MNFKEAYEKMREGKKVKRKGRSSCCFYDSEAGRICTGDGLVITGIDFEAALADDWEIVEEPKSKVYKPKPQEMYYFLAGDGTPTADHNLDDGSVEKFISIGNCFETGEEAKIIDSSDKGYLVEKGSAKVTVPHAKVQLTEKVTRTYKVIKSTSIKNDKNEIVRNLFIGEELEEISMGNGYILAKTSDGVKGNVSLSCLELTSENKTKQEVKVEKKENKDAKNYEIEASGQAKEAINLALDKLGSTYVYGDTGKDGYDCSGLIYAVYKNQLGINLPRTSSEQSQYGKQVSRSDLQAGDLIFFNTSGNGVSHVGIYMGNGEFVHASSGQKKVVVSKLSENYYDTRYVNATRVL